MTLLICPVRPGDDNPELRYALRSWEANLIMSDLTLMVVGDRPTWLEPDGFVEGNRFEGQANVWDNVALGCDRANWDDDEEVVIMNDDFFCLDPVPGVVAVRRDMTLADHIALYPQYRGMWWVRSLDLTASWLADEGHPSPWSYEVHRPLPCKPADMLESLARWTGGMDGDIPQWRTVYGTLNKIDAHPVGDVKFGSVQTPVPSAWRSTSDTSWRKYAKPIVERFQKPSRWER